MEEILTFHRVTPSLNDVASSPYPRILGRMKQRIWADGSALLHTRGKINQSSNNSKVLRSHTCSELMFHYLFLPESTGVLDYRDVSFNKHRHPFYEKTYCRSFFGYWDHTMSLITGARLICPSKAVEVGQQINRMHYLDLSICFTWLSSVFAQCQIR